jgi:hypothetical protein
MNEINLIILDDGIETIFIRQIYIVRFSKVWALIYIILNIHPTEPYGMLIITNVRSQTTLSNSHPFGGGLYHR